MLNAEAQRMSSFESNAKAFAEFTERLRLALRPLQVADAALCDLHISWCNPLKLCVSAFNKVLPKLEYLKTMKFSDLCG